MEGVGQGRYAQHWQGGRMADTVKAYLSRIGARGGAAGRGKVKARTRAQAQAAAWVRWAKHNERTKGEPMK